MFFSKQLFLVKNNKAGLDIFWGEYTQEKDYYLTHFKCGGHISILFGTWSIVMYFYDFCHWGGHVPGVYIISVITTLDTCPFSMHSYCHRGWSFTVLQTV